MALALRVNGVLVLADRGSTYEGLAPSALRAVLATALVAGAEYLTPATSTPSAEDVRVDAAYQRGVEAGRVQAPPETGRAEAYAEGCRHGVNVGRAEGPEVFTLVSAPEPTDYQVWRDAMLIAGQRTPVNEHSPQADFDDVDYNARKYLRSLRTCGFVQPELEDCCYACGDEEHATADCPHQAEAETRVTETEAAADDPLLDHI